MARTIGATNNLPAKTGEQRVRCYHCGTRRYISDMFAALSFKGTIMYYYCSKCIAEKWLISNNVEAVIKKKKK